MPYLFIFILAGGGIIAAIAVKLCDKSVRGEHDRWDPGAIRRVLGIEVIG
jgi:hypothetical protein